MLEATFNECWDCCKDISTRSEHADRALHNAQMTVAALGNPEPVEDQNPAARKLTKMFL